MFRPPLLQRIISGQIGGLSVTFNGDMDALDGAMLALRADARLQNIAFFGAGRFVGSSAEATGDAPSGAIRDGGGLSVELPAVITGGGTVVWMVGGAAFTLDELSGYATGEFGGMIVLDNVPPGGAWFGYLDLVFDPETGYSLEATWLANADATKRRAGSPCIGKVITDADSVTAIDHSAADVIWSMSFLQTKIAVLSGSGGDTSGGGTDTGPRFATQLPISPDDATNTKTYIDDGNAERDAKIALLSGGVDLFPPPFDILADEIALNRVGLGEVNPPSIERGQISVVGANFGRGQNDTPNYSPDTLDPLELPWDAVTGLFGP